MAAGVTDVGLAHLDEVSSLGQKAQGGIDELARKAIENDVHALPLGRAQEVRFEVEIARRGEVVIVEAELVEGVPLARARGREDLGPEMAGELHGGDANATRCRVDEHALPSPQMPEVDQAVVGGEKDDGYAGALDEGPAFRHSRDHPFVGDSDGAEGAGEEPHDSVAHGEAADGGPDLGDEACAFTTQRPRVSRVHAEGVEDVSKVDAGGMDGDADLPGVEWGFGLGVRGERQGIEGAFEGDVQAPRGSERRDQHLLGARPRQCRYEAETVAQRELPLAGSDGRGQRAS